MVFLEWREGEKEWREEKGRERERKKEFFLDIVVRMFLVRSNRAFDLNWFKE